MSTHTSRPLFFQVTQIEMSLEISHADFNRAFESVLGRMQVEALGELASLSSQAARVKLASFVGPFDFTLFQKIDRGAIVTVLASRDLEATTYVFGNALNRGRYDQARGSRRALHSAAAVRRGGRQRSGARHV